MTTPSTVTRSPPSCAASRCRSSTTAPRPRIHQRCRRSLHPPHTRPGPAAGRRRRTVPGPRCALPKLGKPEGTPWGSMSEPAKSGNVWDDVLPRRTVGSSRQPAGARTSASAKASPLLVVDVIYNFVGDVPEPILESIKRWRYSCGERGWEGVKHLERLIAAAREKQIPIVYTGMDRPPAGRFRPGRLELEELPLRRGLGHQGLAWQRDRQGDRARTRGHLLRQGQAECLPRHPPARLPDLSGRDTVITTGTTTSGCVRASAVDATQYNYRLDRARGMRLGPFDDLAQRSTCSTSR